MLFCSRDAVRHGLKEQHKMEELQMKIIDCLRDHCTYNHEAQKKSNFFSRILGKTAELRSLSREGLQRMYFFKLENIIRAPPIIENLYLSSQLPFWILLPALGLPDWRPWMIQTRVFIDTTCKQRRNRPGTLAFSPLSCINISRSCFPFINGRFTLSLMNTSEDGFSCHTRQQF